MKPELIGGRNRDIKQMAMTIAHIFVAPFRLNAAGADFEAGPSAQDIELFYPSEIIFRAIYG